MISIVTVCYNAAQEIEKTIQSVLSQTYTDYEYVFVDGASKDETVGIIESYRDQFEKKGVQYHVTSEPDRGIYDAMNKGSVRATGEWVLMLNAGDRLLNENVFHDVFAGKNYDADVVYGNSVYVDCLRGVYFYKKTPAKPLEYMNQRMAFCHQSVFVRGDVLRKYGFDTTFKITADYDQFLRMIRDGVPFEKVETYISLYELTGFSVQNGSLTLSESAKAREKNGFVQNQTAITGVYQKIKSSMRNHVKNIFSRWFFSSKRGWYRTLEEALQS